MAFGQGSVYANIGAEQLIGAKRGAAKIAVGVQVFDSTDEVRDLEVALGQYVFYRSLWQRVEPDRQLFLAVPNSAYKTTIQEPIARPALDDLDVSLLAFDPDEEKIVRWTR